MKKGIRKTHHARNRMEIKTRYNLTEENRRGSSDLLGSLTFFMTNNNTFDIHKSVLFVCNARMECHDMKNNHHEIRSTTQQYSHNKVAKTYMTKHH